ncbi:MAG: O-antigen ligase family protein, partial [Bacteroidales bacterium]
PRVYEVIWEIDGYLRGGDPSGHSIAQRIAYLNGARSIFLSHPFIGVGTGDVQSSFDRYYKKNESKLDQHYRRRAHNQYITFLITFGIVGFILSMIFLLSPVFIEKRWKDYLFIVFFFIALLSMLNEDTLETQTGVSFIMFFYCLFLFGREKKEIEK